MSAADIIILVAIAHTISAAMMLSLGALYVVFMASPEAPKPANLPVARVVRRG